MKVFIWNDKKDAPIIRFTNHGITFNEQAILALGSPERIAIGVGENNKFAVRAANTGDTFTYAFSGSGNDKDGVIMISGIRLTNIISRDLQRSLGRRGSYVLTAEADNGTLVFDYSGLLEKIKKHLSLND